MASKAVEELGLKEKDETKKDITKNNTKDNIKDNTPYEEEKEVLTILADKAYYRCKKVIVG